MEGAHPLPGAAIDDVSVEPSDAQDETGRFADAPTRPVEPSVDADDPPPPSSRETSATPRLEDVTEAALAEVLTLAARAGRWELAEAVVAELRRRSTRLSDGLAEVIAIGARR